MSRNRLATTFLITTAMSYIAVCPVLASNDLRMEAVQANSDTSAKTFRFDIDEARCIVTHDGRGTCNKNGRSWSYRLPTGSGEIQALYAASDLNAVLVYSVGSDESGWAVAVGLDWGKKEPKWVHHIRGLNLDAPVLSNGMIVIAASEYVASISALEGSILWRHEWQYDGSGRTIPQLHVKKGKVIFSMVNAGDRNDTKKTCFVLQTGAFIDCISYP